MMKVLLQVFIAGGLLCATHSFAHEGHDHAPGEDTIGPNDVIVITGEAKQNLGVVVSEAVVESIPQNVPLSGIVQGIPSQSRAITSRIPGRLWGLHVAEGQRIQAGDALVEVESLQPGNPPPRVSYPAPIAGVVTDVHVQLGEPVSPDQHLLEVVNLDAVYVEAQAFEGQIAAIKVGQSAAIAVEAFPGATFAGEVERLGGALDAASRTLKVWIRVNNPDLRLRPNMRATVRLQVSETGSVVVVPQSAILGDLGQFFVFVQSDANPLEFIRRPVIVGSGDGNRREIVEGVLPGELVVSAGNYQLQYVKGKPTPGETSPTQALPHAGTGSGLSWLLLGLVAGSVGTVLVTRLLRRRV